MLPKPPKPEPPRIWTFEDCAPRFSAACDRIITDMADRGHAVKAFETIRTPERQRYLFGFGRVWDDGRGDVTKVDNVFEGWHIYGVAADLVQDDATPWIAPMAFWNDLGRIAESHGCTWGGRWKQLDLPHIQWGKCPRKPTDDFFALFKSGGRQAVWKVLQAA